MSAIYTINDDENVVATDIITPKLQKQRTKIRRRKKRKSTSTKTLLKPCAMTYKDPVGGARGALAILQYLRDHPEA